MEKNKEEQACSSGHGCCGGYGHGHFGGHMICKVIMILVVLGLVCGAAFHFARFERFGGHGMMGGYYGPSMMSGYFDDDFGGKGSQLFGTITKVEGNQITILDNSAKEQVVTSTAETMILSGTTQVGLSSLQVGKNILVMQGKGEKKDKDEAATTAAPLEAKVIKVL